MNIKGFVSNIVQFTKGPSESRASGAPLEAKLDANNDREGNGQASDGEPQKRRPLTPEEIQEAIKHLENLAGVKENNLTVRLDSTDGINVVYIEDREGKVVRRLPESDLQQLTPGAPPRKSGNILNRAG